MKLFSTFGLALLGVLAGASSLHAEPLNEQTRKNLETAMHGEAYANLKYLAYAERAEREGDAELAKLFHESANVEANEHFDREAALLGLAGPAKANLGDAAEGEHYESTRMYVTFAEQAEKAGDHKAAQLFRQIAGDEADHYARFQAALKQRATASSQ